MITKTKLPEIRKESFIKAREGLGLSTKDLSGMACLSVRQIEQIENGEGSSFYGAQVKFTAAKKVAGLLKLTPEEAFDFSGVAQPVKPAEAEEKLQEETKAYAAEKKAKSGKAEDSSEVKEKTEEKAEETPKTAPKEVLQAKVEKPAPAIKPAVEKVKEIPTKKDPMKKIMFFTLKYTVTRKASRRRP